MKNNIILSILVLIFCFSNSAFSESFILKSKNIEILDEGNKIIANNGKAISNDNTLEISSNKFIYIKDLDILESIGNGLALIKSEKLQIKYDNAIFDQTNFSPGKKKLAEQIFGRTIFRLKTIAAENIFARK